MAAIVQNHKLAVAGKASLSGSRFVGLKQIAKRVLPASVRNILRNAHANVTSTCTSAWLELIHRRRIRTVTGNQLLVNIGCGQLVHSGWVNLDKIVSKGVYYVRLDRGISLPTGVARHIHCEHFLEHLEYERAFHFLAECHRVLQEGGSIRVIVPDAERYIRAYCQHDTFFFEKLKNLGGAVNAFRTPIEVINRMFRMAGAHHFAWDFETLSLALKECGFSHIVQSQIHDIAPELDIDGTDWWRPFESLYLNASK